MTKITKTLIILSVLIGLIFVVVAYNQPEVDNIDNNPEQKDSEGEESFPMFIETLRAREYPGGNFMIEETLPNGTNYRQFIASYLSEGLKIYGLLTVPTSLKPENGYPGIVFVHGYISPKEYFNHQ